MDMNIQVGQPAPQFTCNAVVDNLLKEVSLSSYAEASHWTILLFFPKAWSPVCPTEIKAFSDRLEEFLYARACAILFASTDSLDCLKAWNNTDIMEGGLGNVHMPLISDCNHRLSRAYGVLNEEAGVSQRAFFLIDPNGIIRAISSNDAYIARNVSEVLRLLDALIFKDEHGEGCPADWQKGDEGVGTIAADQVNGALEIKKSFSNWLRPKLERAISSTAASGPSIQRAAKQSVDTINTITANDKTQRKSNDRSTSALPSAMTIATPQSVQSSATGSPAVGNLSPAMTSPRSVDYFSPRTPTAPVRPPSTSRPRLELHLEEASMHQKMENMNAALENYRQSVGTPC